MPITGSTGFRPAPRLLYEHMFRQINTLLVTVGDILDDMLVGDSEVEASERERWEEAQAFVCDEQATGTLVREDAPGTSFATACDGGRHYPVHLPLFPRRDGEVTPSPIGCDTPVHHQAGPSSRPLPL